MALYVSLEAVQAFTDPDQGIPMIRGLIRGAADNLGGVVGEAAKVYDDSALPREEMVASTVRSLLKCLSVAVGKPLYVFFDEADCLSGATVITFLQQLRDCAVSLEKGKNFPASIALIGMRNIRDYKAQIRPDSETLGSASPFNVVTEALTLRTFSEQELRALYAQHTVATGQVFTEEALGCLLYTSPGPRDTR